MDRPLNENQVILRQAIFVIVTLLVVWLAFGRHHTSTLSPTPSPATNQTDLKVESSTGSSATTTNPQATASPVDNSSEQVQSGQPNLQPAQNSSQLPQSIKQELGL